MRKVLGIIGGLFVVGGIATFLIAFIVQGIHTVMGGDVLLGSAAIAMGFFFIGLIISGIAEHY